MRKRRAVLCQAESEQLANRAVVLMASQGIDATVDAADVGLRFNVTVAEADIDRARRIFMEEYPHGLPRETAEEDHASADPITPPITWFGRGGPMVVAILVACGTMFWLVHGGSDLVNRARMIEMGAISYALVEQGEYWRLAAAIFLHFDFTHLLANMGTFIIVAPPFAHLVGPWRLLSVFLATGVAGNMASHELAASAALKAGASGGIAGIIGALGGHALRRDRRSAFKSWHIVGALAAFYAFLIGFGPGRDNVAHIGGMLAGVACGLLIEPRDPPGVGRPWQGA